MRKGWMAAGGGPDEQYYSRLDQLNAGNVGTLGFAWEYAARTLRGRVQHGMQATALVVDGVMYVSGPWSVVYALDAKSGAERWHFDPKVDGAIARRSCTGRSTWKRGGRRGSAKASWPRCLMNHFYNGTSFPTKR